MLTFAQHGRISKRERSHARAMLVEAAWAAAKAPGAPAQSKGSTDAANEERQKRCAAGCSHPLTLLFATRSSVQTQKYQVLDKKACQSHPRSGYHPSAPPEIGSR